MKVIILGAGVSGLGCAFASGLPVYEAADHPGGICSSYYQIPGDETHYFSRPPEAACYHFEHGGGHWIFGVPEVFKEFLTSLAELRTYERKTGAIFLNHGNLFIAHPVQNDLAAFDKYIPNFSETVVREIEANYGKEFSGSTMSDWLKHTFGESLYNEFFAPYVERYTAGLMRTVAPQDLHKAPMNLEHVRNGANKLYETGKDVGHDSYNPTYIYPTQGMNTLISAFSKKCDIQYGKKAIKIDTKSKVVYFSDGSEAQYDRLISTLPITQMLALSETIIDEETPPHVSTLVLNIGAIRGANCPEEHWLYFPTSSAGFHRIGFYSNIDDQFHPQSPDEKKRVSLYVERAYSGQTKPSETDITQYMTEVVKELQSLGYVTEVEVLDPSWIDCAYTCELPDSQWRNKALATLNTLGITSLGRYGRWRSQGISESLGEGLLLGSCLNPSLAASRLPEDLLSALSILYGIAWNSNNPIIDETCSVSPEKSLFCQTIFSLLQALKEGAAPEESSGLANILAIMGQFPKPRVVEETRSCTVSNTV